MKSEDKIRIAIIEDNRYVRDGWRITFESVPDFEVVGSYQNCEDAFQTNNIGEADVLLLDIRLPGITGIEGANYLSERYPHLLIVMCTLYEDDENIFNAILAGALGFISKRAAPTELISSILNLVQGGSPMTPNVARKVLSFIQSKESDRLTSGKKTNDLPFMILNMLAAGKSYQTIAEELSLNVEEILLNIRNIYKTLHSKYTNINY